MKSGPGDTLHLWPTFFNPCRDCFTLRAVRGNTIDLFLVESKGNRCVHSTVINPLSSTAHRSNQWETVFLLFLWEKGQWYKNISSHTVMLHNTNSVETLKNSWYLFHYFSRRDPDFLAQQLSEACSVSAVSPRFAAAAVELLMSRAKPQPLCHSTLERAMDTHTGHKWGHRSRYCLIIPLTFPWLRCPQIFHQ